MILEAMINEVSGPINSAAVREKILELEGHLAKFPQVDLPVTHFNSGGLYARLIVIPKDILLTGAIYKDAHFDVMISGDITVSSDEGKKRLTGFNVMESKAGKKRAGYAHEDTVWMTFHLCEVMPEDDYVQYLTVDKFEELEFGGDE